MAKAQYWEEMVRMWSLVPIPAGVQRLGTLVVHDINLADILSELTPEEQAIIEAKRKLEDVVKPMCEWVASHTIKSEKQVTPILVILQQKRTILPLKITILPLKITILPLKMMFLGRPVGSGREGWRYHAEHGLPRQSQFCNSKMKILQ